MRITIDREVGRATFGSISHYGFFRYEGAVYMKVSTITARRLQLRKMNPGEHFTESDPLNNAGATTFTTGEGVEALAVVEMRFTTAS